MAIVPRQILCPASKKPIKCPYSMTPTRIVVHNTANNVSAENEIRYMISNNKEVSFHFAVDDKEVVQGLPLNVNSWNAGDGGKGKGNREGISIEICYSKSGGKKFTDAEKLAAKFIAQLLKERGWGVDKVTKHQDYNGKNCPHRTLAMGWERFLAMVQVELDELNKPVVKPVVESTTSTKIKKGDLVSIASNAVYYSGKAIPSWVKKMKWYVTSVSNNRAVIDKSEDGKKSICSPIDVKYLTIVKTTTTTTTKKEEPKEEKPTTPTTPNIVAGKEVKLNKCPLYASSGTTSFTARANGTYYLWDAKVTNKRIRITNNKARVGKSGQITGWIDVSYVK